MGTGAGGGGGLVIPQNTKVEITNPAEVKKSEAAAAIEAAKQAAATPGAVAATAVTDTKQTETKATQDTAAGKVPTAADAVLAIQEDAKARKKLLKSTLGAGQAV